MDCIAHEGSFIQRSCVCVMGYIVVTAILTTIVFCGVFGLANPDKPAYYGIVSKNHNIIDQDN